MHYFSLPVFTIFTRARRARNATTVHLRDIIGRSEACDTNLLSRTTYQFLETYKSSSAHDFPEIWRIFQLALIGEVRFGKFAKFLHQLCRKLFFDLNCVTLISYSASATTENPICQVCRRLIVSFLFGDFGPTH